MQSINTINTMQSGTTKENWQRTTVYANLTVTNEIDFISNLFNKKKSQMHTAVNFYCTNIKQ